MNYQKLKDLIDTEPLNAARTDAEVLSWLQEDVTVQKGITYQDLIVWSSAEGIARKIKAAIASEEATPGTWTNPVYNDVLVLQTLLSSGGDLDLSRDDVRGIVSGISGAGLPLTAPNKTALFAFSNEDVLRYESEGFRLIDDPSWLYHINAARAL